MVRDQRDQRHYMKAWMVVAANEPLESIALPTPVPKGTEVLIEVTHCGVCHSDLHFWKGEYNMGGGKVMKLADRGVELPRAPGHEIAGRVAALGPDSVGVAIGDVRVVYPWLGCGNCVACHSGQDNMCPTPKAIGVIRNGGYGSHVLVPDARYLADPGGVDPALACTYACSGITVYSAIQKLMPIDPQQPVLLVGAGGLGLMAIAMLKALGHNHIVSVDIDEAKRNAASAAGATQTIDGAADRLTERILATCGPVAGVLDFVSNDRTSRASFDALCKGGSLIVIGVAGGEITLSLAGLVFRAQTVRGSLTGTPQDLRDVLALANTGRLAPTPISLCSHEQANQALIDLRAGRVTGRSVLVWN
jgi:alcohol dehydrogenase/propanol-preferring alcohol dehydrogenase